ncbi:hypothetical protein GmHk_12G034888 [Glycine max]|nr:hypothetical protein GmHk_12G034888 [Glycine max]
MQNSKRDVYLGAYLNAAHWQMVIILPKENVVIWFCSLHNRPNNYLKGIINSALKGFNDNPQSKSKVTLGGLLLNVIDKKEALSGYYYFNDVRPLEPQRLKAFHI